MTHELLLVTAFEPFGLVRGHVPGLKGNRSQALLIDRCGVPQAAMKAAAGEGSTIIRP